jgi:DNA (cytosine-5)-methyltransferase 3A
MKAYNVLSVFNGYSGGHMALDVLDIKVDKYYSSEIDKYANIASNAMYPGIINMGNIEHWREWNIDFSKIDLFIGGSPCQGFSFAGKQLNFSDPRSKLFFVYVDILNYIRKLNPNIKFLLENVQMKKEYLRIISEYLGVFPVNINSNLVSAQNRNRWYWSNIKTRESGLFSELWTDIPQPIDRKIFLKHIIQDEKNIDEKYYLSEKMHKSLIEWTKRNKEKGNGFKAEIRGENEKSTALTTGAMKSSSTYIKLDKQLNKKTNQDKASCLTGGGNSGGNHSDMDIICINPKTNNKQTYQQDRIYSDEGKSVALCAEHADLKIRQKGRGFNKGGVFTYKSPTLTSNAWEQNNHISIDYKLRRLTPYECGKLQTVPENKLQIMLNCGVSDTQLYKMFGNGWTVDVIAHIFSFL